MEFAQRFPAVQERFDRFWEGRDTDRPVLFITAPRENADTPVAPPRYARTADRVLPENMLAAARYLLARTAYVAEGYPHFFVNYGPGILHGCIGGEADFSSADTVWFPPFLGDIEEFSKLRFDPRGRCWALIRETTMRLLEELGEELVVSFADLGGAADILASAIGTEQLLFDVIERPQAVRAALGHCHELWMEAYELDHSYLHPHQDVTTPWWPVLSRGRTYMTQCDFNAMVSAQVFSDLFVGELGDIWRALDHGCYHLDGIGTEIHVPSLLAEGGLRCVQWVPAPGTSALRHARMLRGIQEAGVCITFTIRRGEVEQACALFDPRRLMLVVGCESVAQGEQLVEDALRWCEGRHW
jgi:hypothetical protein